LRPLPLGRATTLVVQLLGPLDELDLDGIDWLIAGGESGRRHRPVRPEWIRDLRDRCHAEGVSFFLKQWGGRTPKAGGRLLDGVEWSEMPVGCDSLNSRNEEVAAPRSAVGGAR
jgi:protein gp37